MKLDACRFSQIVMNLISNAVKFTSSGDIKVRMIWQPANKFKLRSIPSLVENETLFLDGTKLRNKVWYSTEQSLQLPLEENVLPNSGSRLQKKPSKGTGFLQSHLQLLK